MSSKPSVFIGSSGKSSVIAETIGEMLDDVAYATPWTYAFDLSSTTIETLQRQLGTADFSIFVMSPDDVAEIKGTTYKVVRDNVVFELGLFIRKLGRERCFMVLPKELKDPATGKLQAHLPTDLAGITYGDYDPLRPDGNTRAALNSFVSKVKRQMIAAPSATVRPSHEEHEEVKGQLDDAKAAIEERDKEIINLKEQVTKIAASKRCSQGEKYPTSRYRSCQST